jgi:hypothetical protein
MFPYRAVRILGFSWDANGSAYTGPQQLSRIRFPFRVDHTRY